MILGILKAIFLVMAVLSFMVGVTAISNSTKHGDDSKKYVIPFCMVVGSMASLWLLIQYS